VAAPVAPSPAGEAPALASAPTGSLAELLASARRTPLSPQSAGPLFVIQEPARAPQIQAAPVPSRPAAPPFPFKYAGWFQEGRGSTKVYLSRGDIVFPMKAGDVLEGFRIDAVQGERIEVTYLASGEHSSLLLASLTGAAGGATFAEASATALSPQSAAAGSSSGGMAASAPGASQAAVLAAGVVRGPAASAAATPMTSRSAGLISQAVGAAEKAASSGSMPIGPVPALAVQPGPVPSGAFPASSVPSGKLGVEPAAAGQLGSEAAPSGKLGR
jgi:hypothetical protein